MSVVVVSFNTRDALSTCLMSVMAARPERVVVVDNGSSDGSAELVRDTYPHVHLIADDHNHGYGAAANRGIAACATPGVLLLNSDTVVGADVLEPLSRYLAEHPRVAVVGPRLVGVDGKLQRSTYPFPSAADILLGETGLHLLIRRIPGLRERFWRTWSHDESRRVPWVLGAALAIRRSAFDAVGGFDTSYFMYGEETDLCRRLANVGFETHYAPVATIVHVGGESTRQYTDAMQYELIVSNGRYMRRYESRAKARRVLRTLKAIRFLRLARDVIRLRFTRDAGRRNRLRVSLEAGKSLLADRKLWTP